ncbi:MAG TPA: hypothetical protein VF306_11015 [Pirellulales bacterium]
MLIAWIKQTLAPFSRVNPRYWRAYAHALARSDGWAPPMLVLAVLGFALFSGTAIGRLGNWQIILSLKLLTWLAWLVVGVGANLIVIGHSLAHLWRFGVWGWSRPRWWFELARLFWIATLLAFLSFGVAVLVPPKNLGQLVNAALNGLLQGSKYLIVGSFVVATIGYAASFILRRPRRGRAFQCVHYFYTLLGGIAFITYAATAWPPAVIWPNGAVLMATGIAGIGLFAGGVVSTMLAASRREKAEDMTADQDAIHLPGQT